jgi:hypothetical protein
MPRKPGPAIRVPAFFVVRDIPVSEVTLVMSAAEEALI